MTNPPRQATEAVTPRKAYSPPRLKTFGSIRDFTLGISGGLGESGDPEVKREPGDPGDPGPF